MKLLKEVAILFGISFVGLVISSLLPIPVPASILAMVLLLLLLITKIIKEKQIKQISTFFLDNMTLFFIPASVGILKNIPLFKASIFPLFAVCVLSTIVTFAAAYSASSFVSSLLKKRGKEND